MSTLFQKTWLRRLSWVVLALLSLAFVLIVTRAWIGHQAQQRFQALQVKHPTPPTSLFSPTSPLIHSDSKDGPTALRKVPLIGGFFGNEEEKRQLEARLEELRETLKAMQVVEGYDFAKIMQILDPSLPEGLSAKEAAELFLKVTAKYADLLTALQEALAQRPWPDSREAWQSLTEWGEAWNKPCALLMSLSNLIHYQTEAHWQLGQTEAAWDQLKTSAELSQSLIVNGILIDHITTAARSSYFRQSLTRALQPNRLTDTQLAELPSLIKPVDMMKSFQEGLKGEMALVNQAYENVDAVKLSIAKGFHGSNPFVNTINDLHLALTTESQIAANRDLILSEHFYQYGLYDADKRMLRPLSADEISPAKEMNESTSWLEKYYFTWSFPVGSTSKVIDHSVFLQSALDQSLIAAAVEQYRRQTGHVPESLADLGKDQPHDIATGLPYRYTKTENDGFRLWGAGPDRTDEGGDSKSDAVFGK